MDEHNSSRSYPVAVRVEGKQTRKRRLEEPEVDYERTVVYRPKRTSATAEQTIVNKGRGSAGQNVGRNRNDYYEDDYYDTPIDEELLDEQVIQEMMDEDDREGEEIWNRISGKNAKKNTRRNKNAR